MQYTNFYLDRYKKWYKVELLAKKIYDYYNLRYKDLSNKKLYYDFLIFPSNSNNSIWNNIFWNLSSIKIEVKSSLKLPKKIETQINQNNINKYFKYFFIVKEEVNLWILLLKDWQKIEDIITRKKITVNINNYNNLNNLDKNKINLIYLNKLNNKQFNLIKNKLLLYIYNNYQTKKPYFWKMVLYADYYEKIKLNTTLLDIYNKLKKLIDLNYKIYLTNNLEIYKNNIRYHFIKKINWIIFNFIIKGENLYNLSSYKNYIIWLNDVSFNDKRKSFRISAFNYIKLNNLNWYFFFIT